MFDINTITSECRNRQVHNNTSVASPNILVIRPGALGDVISTLPALAAIKDHFPQSRLEMVGVPATLELLKESGYADAVRSFDWAPFAKLYNERTAAGRLLKDFLVVFDYIIAYVGNKYFVRNLERIASCPVMSVHPRKIPPKTHVVDHLLKPMSFLGKPVNKRTPCLKLSDKWHKVAREFLETHFPQRGKSILIAVHPGSGGKRKIWPYWKDFITRLLREKCLDVLIFSGPAEKKEINEWRETLCLDKNLVENPPLPLLGALLGNCDLYLGNDSGVTHLAAAMGKRTIALFGPSDPETWKPRGDTISPPLKCTSCTDNLSCSHLSCLENFHPDDLWKMVKSEIDNSHCNIGAR